jgi:hypothetical protein
MKLGRRPTRKKDQALDVVASAAQTWSKWHLGKRAGQGVAKGAKKAAALKPGGRPSLLKRIVSGTPAKIAGGLAVLGGLGTLVARKLKGGGSADTYTPPPPHEPAAAPPPPPPPPPNPTAAAITHDAPPPPSLSAAPDPPDPPPPLEKPETSIAVEDLSEEDEPGDDEQPAAAGEDDDPVEPDDDAKEKGEPET